MEHQFPHIFSPIKIGSTIFKNRIWSAPAGTHLLQAQEPYPTEATIAYYREKARGGTANITFSAQNMDILEEPNPVHNACNVFLPQYHRYWQRLTSSIHFFGAKASLELLAFTYHGYDSDGKLTGWSVNGGYHPMMQEDLPMMPTSEFSRIAGTYADAAENALACGFDMILIHGGHGLFISQTLSPIYNKRTDEFGGSFENRMRFTLMILDAIRARVGKKILIEFRISGDELAGEGAGGWEIEDTLKFVKTVQDRIDLIHVSTGSMMNKTEHIMHPTYYLPPAPNVYLAAQVKADPEVKIPVLTLGAFQDPDLIEETLATGQADVIAMARGTIADAELVNKAFTGKTDEIIPCIKCFNCLDFLRVKEFGCAVNPTVGREYSLPGLIPPAGEKKKVVIIGGGPAGMSAAIYASEQGHKVVLYEKGKVLGGKIVFSEYTDFKYDLYKYLEYQKHMVEKLGVTVKLGTEATPGTVMAEHPDVVIAAIGADPVIPPILGIGGSNVMTAEECYNRTDTTGSDIVIIGGGEVGCETALYLADKGKKVTIIEMLEDLSPETFHLIREAMMQRIEKTVAYHVGARCSSIDATGVVFTDKEGREQKIETDTVVIAAGMKSRTEAAEAFRAVAPVFWNIGDSYFAKNVLTCTRSAFDAAMQI